MELLDEILGRPDANILLRKAKEVLNSEDKNRQQFYEEITPNDRQSLSRGK